MDDAIRSFFIVQSLSVRFCGAASCFIPPARQHRAARRREPQTESHQGESRQKPVLPAAHMAKGPHGHQHSKSHHPNKVRMMIFASDRNLKNIESFSSRTGFPHSSIIWTGTRSACAASRIHLKSTSASPAASSTSKIKRIMIQTNTKTLPDVFVLQKNV